MKIVEIQKRNQFLLFINKHASLPMNMRNISVHGFVGNPTTFLYNNDVQQKFTILATLSCI